MADDGEMEKLAAIRGMVATASMILWHRHEHGGRVEYTMTLVANDGRRHTSEGRLDLLHTLLDAAGVLVTKHCSRCRKHQPLMLFSGDGNDRWCLPCRRECAREYRASKRGELRRCPRCQRMLRGKEFNKGNRWCKKCFSHYNRERYQWWDMMGGEYVI